MASGAAAPPLSERLDIHKSCKSLETLVNVLNDYCEAAVAIVSLQKKLAKALRESAGLKVTGEIAANAFNASASIFDAMSDIDGKFAKVMDKECEGISTEVRKWFKKLAKEEKAHDERLNNANARIKQAGQVYEKKSKRSARDATEEHARYINLISSLGPEISQDKYNHALFVTQRHSSTTYAVAACVSRVADAEWLRSCEEVRRFSPTIGQLGEWRALCEGGWTGAVPRGLPDIEQPQRSEGSDVNTNSQRAMTDDDSKSVANTADNRILRDPAPDSANANGNTDGERVPAGLVSNRAEHEYGKFSIGAATPPRQHAYSAQSNSNPPSSQTSSLDPPRPPFGGDRMDSVASIASLTSFPAPPTHFPIPPAFTAQQLPTQSPTQPPSNAAAFPVLARVTESPVPPGDDGEGLPPEQQTSTPVDEPKLAQAPNGADSSPVPRALPNMPDTRTAELGVHMGNTTYTHSHENLERHASPAPARRRSLLTGEILQGAEKTTSNSVAAVSATHPRGDYLADDREPGVRGDEQLQSRSIDAIRSTKKGVERSESVTSNSGSIVAAMRTRYTQATGPSSPPPRDLPKLPLSVSNLATRYQPTDTPASPRQRTTSPITERPRALSVATMPSRPSADTSYKSPAVTGDEDVASRRRRQRIDELAELEMKEREFELREREREIEAKARELERDRANLLNYGARGGDGYTSDASQSGGQTKRPLSQVDFTSAAGSQARYSYSTTHLVPPPSSQTQQSRPQSHSQSSSNSPSHYSRSQPSSPVPDSRPTDHAPYCGCDSCSISKYKLRNQAPSPHDLRPPEPPISLRPEKPKGWMRRLSMPVVGNAFSLDSKKSGGIGRNSVVLEDGRIGGMGYGAGISNRSMTNLGRR